MKSLTLKIIAAFALLAVVLPSCKKSCDAPGKSTLKLNFYPFAGSDELVFNQEYIVNGRKLKFTRAQFYVSTIRLKKANNTTSTPEMPFALVHALETNYNTGLIDTGNYSFFEFSIGVDSATNHGDPAQWSATHPLYVNGTYSTYWTWSQGYVFIRLEGYVDASPAGNGNPTTGFSYHIGNDELLRNISLPINRIIEGNENSIEINVDYAKMLEDVDFQTELQTHSGANEPLTLKIADKAAEAITLK